MSRKQKNAFVSWRDAIQLLILIFLTESGEREIS